MLISGDDYNVTLWQWAGLLLAFLCLEVWQEVRLFYVFAIYYWKDRLFEILKNMVLFNMPFF